MSKNGLSSLADEHVKGRFRPDSWPNWPKTKTTKIAGLAQPKEEVGQGHGEIECRERLGGLLRYYHRKAA